MTADVAVVGAGIGGLVVARELAKAGLAVEVCEATDAVGGLVGKATIAGVEVDTGPESFATRGGHVAALVDELELDREQPAPLGSWLVHHDGAAPSPAGGLLGIPRDVTAPDVVRVIGAEASQRALEDLRLPPEVGTASGMLGELVRERMGDTVLERLVAPIAAGVYSTPVDELPIERVAPGLIERIAEHGSLQAAVKTLRGNGARPGALIEGIRGGMHTLAEALANDLQRRGGRVFLNSPVGDPAALDAREVVLAAPPAHESGQSTEVVTLAFERGAIDGAPRGTGALVAPAARGIRAKALTHSSAKWPWLAQAAPHLDIMRLSYASGEVVALATALSDAAAILGKPLPHPIETSRRVLVQPPAPGQVAVPKGVTAAGSWVAGTGLASVVPASIATAKELSQRLTGITEGVT